MKRAAQEQVAAAATPDFRRLFESAPGSFLVLAPDRGFTILAASDRYLRDTSTEREAVIGRGLFEVFPDDPVDPGADGPGRLRASLERLIAGSRSDVMAVRRRDARRPKKAGGARKEHYWRVTNHAVRSETGGLLYLIHQLEDVTELVRADARNAALDGALEQANRELESLSYSISHDLRAPLRAIDGFSRILEEDHGDRLDGEARRVLSVIRESGVKMGHLMEGVLTYSRLGRHPMSVAPLDMSRIVRDAFEEACAGAPRLPELKLRPLPQAQGDSLLVKQVWLNLLANAVKFSGLRERAVIEVSALEREVETVYSVRDNGVGFDTRYSGKLFGMFQRLHSENEFPGSGVGLAVVQRLVARHGGRVWGESAPGKGAAFHFSLPKGGSHG